MTLLCQHTDGAGLPVVASEHECRVESFALIAHRFAGQRVVLYGKGKNAEAVAVRCADQGIFMCATADGAASGTVGPLPLRSWDDVLNDGFDTVVIAAKMGSTFAVFDRIRQDCVRQGAHVYDLFGNDLEELDHAVEGAQCTLEEALAILSRYDVVCIDVRQLQVLEPGVLYRAASSHSPVGAFAVMLDAAMQAGKSVVSIGLAGPWGLPALVRYNNADKEQPVNVEPTGLAKENGLFRLVKAMYPGKTIVHFGHDRFNDAVCARVHGVDGFVLACDNNRSASAVLTTIEPKTEAERVAWDLASKREEGGNPVGLMGYRALGPLVAGHVLWLSERLSNPLCSDDVRAAVFAARDGYLSMQAYNLWRHHRPGLPPAMYLLTSRRAAVAPLLDNPVARLGAVQMMSGMSPRQAVCRLYGAYMEGIEAFPDDAMSSDGLLQAFDSHADAVSAAARTARANYRKYCCDLGLEPCATYAFVDFAASGTCQRLLSEFLPYTWCGLYLSRRANGLIDPSEPIESWFQQFDGYVDDRLMTLEALASSADPSVAGFNDDGTPRFDAVTRSARDFETLAQAQEGALAFCRDFFNRVAPLPHPMLRPEFAEGLLQRFDDAAITITTENSFTGAAQSDRITKLDADKTMEGRRS